jgi:hypothetical protein
MPEEPTKLSKRLPKQGKADVALGLTRALVSAIPFAGGPLTELMSLVIRPALARRGDEWRIELALLEEELQKRVDDLTPEKLAQNDAFVSGFIQSTRIAIATNKKEKRRFLRNALLKIGLGRAPSEDKQEIFFNAIESLTVTHVKVLSILHNPSGAMTRAKATYGPLPSATRDFVQTIGYILPEMSGERDLLGAILSELRSRGFSQIADVHMPFPQAPSSSITNMGIEFLNFVAEPDPGSP